MLEVFFIGGNLTKLCLYIKPSMYSKLFRVFQLTRRVILSTYVLGGNHNLLKRKKITSPPNEWRNIPFQVNSKLLFTSHDTKAFEF